MNHISSDAQLNALQDALRIIPIHPVVPEKGRKNCDHVIAGSKPHFDSKGGGNYGKYSPQTTKQLECGEFYLDTSLEVIISDRGERVVKFGHPVIMDCTLYQSIINIVNQYQEATIQVAQILENQFPRVKLATLYSILTNQAQKWTKNSVSRAQSHSRRLYAKYIEAVNQQEPPGIIARIADKASISVILVAKLILAKHICLTLNPPDECLDTTDDARDGWVQAVLKKYLRDTTLIQDKLLAHEIFLCTLNDLKYSPISEVIAMSLGQQYEIKLFRQLERLGITYRSETNLRQAGFDKTPDVKLELPIAINGFVVHWIECKARFGDWDVHQEYLKNQYTSYWNRFGPGLIIYWFGFVTGINQDMEKRFLIRDHLPLNILKLTDSAS